MICCRKSQKSENMLTEFVHMVIMQLMKAVTLGGEND